jgi:rhamnogalacturonan II specific xylosyltransferase
MRASRLENLWLLLLVWTHEVVFASTRGSAATRLSQQLKKRSFVMVPVASADAGTQSMENIVTARMSTQKSPSVTALPPPILSMKFGTKDSPTAKGQHKDYGLIFAPHEAGLSWGWNCDLHRIGSNRERTIGDDILRSFIIPDRHDKCKTKTPIWQISLPPGNYTVRVSTTDPEDYSSSSSAGCFIQGIRLGDISLYNTCAAGNDTACVIFPNIQIEEDKMFQISGSYRSGCKKINYVSFYSADQNTALALATYKEVVKTSVDSQVITQEKDLYNFLSKVANSKHDVIATSVNAGYIDFAMNWICSISKLNITHFFFIATDEESYTYLHSRNYSVFLVKPTKIGEGNTEAVKYGTVQYQELILQRTKLVNKVLQLGFNILLCDIDAVWLENPMPYLSKAYDVQAQQEADGRLCGGFMFLQATEGVKKLWQAVTTAHEEIVSSAEKRHKLRNVDESEQALLLKLLPKSGLKVAKLDSDKFPNGLKYFGSQLTFHSQMNLKTTKPIVVHNNYIIGKNKKLLRFKHFHLWLIGDKDTDYQCHL